MLKLLLALASTVIPGFEPEIHDPRFSSLLDTHGFSL
jgi:hypothetical protein